MSDGRESQATQSKSGNRPDAEVSAEERERRGSKGVEVKTVAIIQARMGSTRLPGKVLMDLGGKTVLARVVQRVQRSRRVDEVVVATTESKQDTVLMEECERLGVLAIRGSSDDVLDRYWRAARERSAEIVIRVTSDCPLIDPELVDETVRVFLAKNADYCSNVFPRRYPRGLDTEVFTFAALDRAWRQAREPHQREHVTPYFYEHPELFRIASAPGEEDYSTHRWTLDTPEDLNLLRGIYESLEGAETRSWREVLAFVETRPELMSLNAHVIQKPVPANISKF